LYANTQATPYSATLYNTPGSTAGFRTSAGKLQIPSGAFTTPEGTLPAGVVMVRNKGTEQVTVATGAAGEKPFGLLANFVGGDLDEGFSGDSLQNSVGVWRGPDSVFEVLSPAFGTISISQDNTSGTVYLYAAADGRLTTTQTNTTTASTEGAGIAAISGGAVSQQVVGSLPVARLVEYVAGSRIVVDLVV